VVAVTQRLVESDTYPENRECLDVRWGGFFRRHDLLPIALPVEHDPRFYFDRFAPSGLILTGGNDLQSISHSSLSARRDAFELACLAIAIERRLFVFAVCRGMQLVAEHFGVRIERVEGHTKGASHPIHVDASSRFGRMLGDLSAVRSYHDYGLRHVPSAFREVARAEDGVIEAMEHETMPIFCQMWHPEREESTSPGETAVLRDLFQQENTR
jgi:putative glutamine amidotransferase